MPRTRRVAAAIQEINRRLEEEGKPLLSDEDKQIILAKAKEEVFKRKRDKAEADYLALAIKNEEREQAAPDEAYEYVTIDLAPFVASSKYSSSFISLDGTRFFQGLTYEVRFAVARTLEDIMARGWEHEREIKGERRKEDINRRPVHGSISPFHSNVNSTSSIRRSI